jgi:hypothetical protein
MALKTDTLSKVKIEYFKLMAIDPTDDQIETMEMVNDDALYKAVIKNFVLKKFTYRQIQNKLGLTRGKVQYWIGIINKELKSSACAAC